MREFRRPTKLDRACAHQAAQAGADGRSLEVVPQPVGGEFDTPHADPAYPEWTCANLAEAFPGPMTPLSLELVRDALFTGADQVALLLPLNERIRDNVRRRQLAIFGHQMYQNSSVLREMASAIPGQTPEDFSHQINGRPYPDGYVRPRPTAGDVAAYIKFLITAGPRLAGVSGAVTAVEFRADEMCSAGVGLADLADERLRARIDSLWNECIEGWKVGLLCTFLVSAPNAMLERRYGASAVSDGTSPALASSRLLQGVTDLAAIAKGRPEAASVLSADIDASSWPELQRRDAQFAARIADLLDVAGHRGPGETELANAVYADAPWLLMRAIAGVNEHRRESPAQPRRDFVGRQLSRLSRSTIEQRERCRDAVMRLTHELRRALREWGTRLAADGSLVEMDDVFYLTREELFAAPTDREALVARRRAERERLSKLDLPLRFTQPMNLDDSQVGCESPTVITGVPAVSGIAVGRVRVMRSPDDEIEPGEVLVTRVTDTGWTPFFATAAAIVTDVGGSMSHAAIVAREFGIPAVVGTEHASRLLTNGRLVEVNGNTGVVTVLD